MNHTKYNIERDLYELTTMALSLEQYIGTEDVFHNPQGQFSNSPMMTLGTFVMRLRRISALQSQLDAGSRAQLGIAIQTHENVATNWAYHYQLKLEREIQMRLRSIQAFFRDLADDAEGTVEAYFPGLLARTVLEELLNQAASSILIAQDVRQEISKVDEEWDAVSHDSYFHWDERLRDVYPKETYWWLYRELNLASDLA